MPRESAAEVSGTLTAANLWASSAEGQNAIDQAVLRALETTKRLDEARKVDFEAIRRPLGMRV